VTATPVLTDPAEAARFLNRYARRWHAGAFATPTAKELAEHPELIHAGPGWVFVGKRLTRDSKRTDYSGRTITLPKGSRVITHLACEPDAALPDLTGWDVVSTYVEDTNVTRQLAAQRRFVAFTRVTAAAELIAAWMPSGTPMPSPPAEDQRTVARIPVEVWPGTRERVLAELSDLTGWFDDYPFYSDGTWGALNLRGFWPDDPTRGVKPAEMSKRWKEEHPADLGRTCDWTTLADAMPETVALARGVMTQIASSARLERVRLLRMAGNGGKGGRLGRHTDITDKASGTRDGQIIRLHLPLVTHPAVTLTAWSLDGRPHPVHLPAWSLWYLDARKPHAVDNPTGVDRIHLVIDCQANEAVRQALRDAEEHAG
jgi:hypothetical protein